MHWFLTFGCHLIGSQNKGHIDSDHKLLGCYEIGSNSQHRCIMPEFRTWCRVCPWQAFFVQEKGRLTSMKDYDERTIWTSDTIPLMASYHKGSFKILMATNVCMGLWVIEGCRYGCAFNSFLFSCRQHAAFGMVCWSN